MLERGFRTDIQGGAMHRSDEPGYNRPEVDLSMTGADFYAALRLPWSSSAGVPSFHGSGTS
jgi:hypothetical protein